MVTTPLVVMSPIELLPSLVKNQSAPSGPTTIPSGVSMLASV